MSNEEDWLVSNKTCKGCMYYGYLSRSGRGIRCCDYTNVTGRIRQEMPKDCKVKKIGELDTSYCVQTGAIMRQERR